MNILLATSEAVPFAKTGGLADVCGALPVELARLGHQVAVIMPAYRQTRYCGQPIEPLGIDFIVPIGSKMVAGHLLRSTMPGGNVPVYLVEQDQYFDRDELYSVDGKDYIDNCERFVFFSRAVLEAIRLLDLQVDVLHANDWQTGLTPAYLKIEYPSVPRYQRIASLLTVHNLSYQGQFWHWDMLLTGSGLEVFQLAADGVPRQPEPVEDGNGVRRLDQHGQSALRAGDSEQPLGLRAGRRVAVSAQRALGDSQRHRPARLEPGTRSAPGGELQRRDGATRSSRSAKPPCRRNWGCRKTRTAPLVGFVGRLIEQKGIDLVVEVMQRWVQTSDVQWAILGTGQPKYHKLLETLAERFPRKVALRLEFSNPLAHRIEAGADLFLMPSRFEPCGLNQLYSLRYGTVPLVRATGGLADTIAGYDPLMPNPAANGFVFPGVQFIGAGRVSAPGMRRLPPPGGMAAIGRRRHGAGLVVGPQRETVRRVVSEDDGAQRGIAN